MDRKKNLQVALLILLILSSIIFYKKFFNKDLNLSEKKINEKKIDSSNPDNKTENSNVIETLKYISQDLAGNTYVINAESAKFEQDKVDRITLFEVNAEISKKDHEIIYIYSKTANYNKINNNTIFRKDVDVKYGDQTINSETLNLNFKDNLIEILDNVYYVSKDTKINADKVEIDLLYKKLKISMINNKDKVNIVGKY